MRGSCGAGTGSIDTGPIGTENGTADTGGDSAGIAIGSRGKRLHDEPEIDVPAGTVFGAPRAHRFGNRKIPGRGLEHYRRCPGCR
jgi:hypothetical protein